MLYREFDLALDPFPCVGGTTTCDSLWMGVPVLTLAGQGFASRMGVSLLQAVGLESCIAHSPADYLQRALGWISQPEQLDTLRHGLRARMQASPLMNEARFAAQFGQAIRHAWRDWAANAAQPPN